MNDPFTKIEDMYINVFRNIENNSDDSDIIDIKKMENRKNDLISLQSIKSKIDELSSNINNIINKAEDIHNKEIMKFTNLVNGLNNMNLTSNNYSNNIINNYSNNSFNKLDNISNKNIYELPIKTNKSNTYKGDWSNVVARKTTNIKSTLKNEEFFPALPTNKQVISKSNNYIKVPISSSYSLEAIPVDSFTEVKPTGNLYYIERTNHFAIRCNETLIHGNIGIIYTNEKLPEKIKNCRFKENCVKVDCDYYHNPEIYSKSKDVRNSF